MDAVDRSMAGEGAARPPRALPALSPRLAQWLAIGWRVLAVAALMLSVLGLWRGWIEEYRIAPAFDAIGVGAAIEGPGHILIGAASGTAERAGVPEEARLTAIGGRPIGAAESGLDVATQLSGPDESITITIEAEDGTGRDITLPRSRAIAAPLEQGANSPFWRFLSVYGFGFVAGLSMLAGGMMLVERRPDDPVSMLLAYAFVMGVTAFPLTMATIAWLGWFDFTDLTTAAFFALLLVVMPAFPDGRFVPRAGRWLAIGAPVLFVLIASDLLPLAVIAGTSFLSALIAAWMPVLRFRRTPPGIERQQLKWAGLGFAVGFVFLAIGGMALFAGELGPWVNIAGMALFNLGFLILPAGVLVSLMRYRLWDADRAIGKSSMVGIVTLTMGALWAAGQEIAKLAVAQIDPSFDPVTVAGVSTAAVAILFPPVQSRIDRWTKRRLEPRLERLRQLPTLIETMAGRASSRQLAAVVLEGAVEGAAAAGGTLAIGGAEAVFTRGHPPGEPGFAVEAGEVRLTIGPRPDGTPLPGAVRALLADLAGPMAEAFGEAQAREAQARTIALLAGRVDTLTAQVAALSAGGSSKARTSSMKRSTEIGLET